MAKKISNSKSKAEVRQFLQDIKTVFSVNTPKKYPKLLLAEYPFDLQLLNVSSVYRKSRELYFSIGGKFSPRVCSTMRGLSAQDLFNNEIDYTPALSEFLWFRDFGYAVGNAKEEIQALAYFNEISLFHEQNHRVIWRLLPPAPTEQKDLSRYLNFAESLVVCLDLILADQLGKKLSLSLERMKAIYRPTADDSYFKKSKSEYRQYLLAVFTSTYFLLENKHPDDILKAVNYVLPSQKNINKAAVKRGRELSEIFIQVTNPQWQNIYWKSASLKLKKIQSKSREDYFYLPDDPLDLDGELAIANRVFDFYGV
jgi:hypothetical protein